MDSLNWMNSRNSSARIPHRPVNLKLVPATESLISLTLTSSSKSFIFQHSPTQWHKKRTGLNQMKLTPTYPGKERRNWPQSWLNPCFQRRNLRYKWIESCLSSRRLKIRALARGIMSMLSLINYLPCMFMSSELPRAKYRSSCITFSQRWCAGKKTQLS